MQAQRGETLVGRGDRPAATTGSKTLPSPAWTERYDGGWDDVKQLMVRSRRRARGGGNAAASSRRPDVGKPRSSRATRRPRSARPGSPRRRSGSPTSSASAPRRSSKGRPRPRHAQRGRRRPIAARSVALIAGAFGLVAVGAALAAGWMSWQATRAEAKAQLGDSLYRAVQARNAARGRIDRSPPCSSRSRVCRSNREDR